MVRRKKELDMKTCVQYILHLIVQILELNWGFSQKLNLVWVCFTQIWLGLNSAFKIIKLHGKITCSWSLTLQLWCPLFWEDGRLTRGGARPVWVGVSFYSSPDFIYVLYNFLLLAHHFIHDLYVCCFLEEENVSVLPYLFFPEVSLLIVWFLGMRMLGVTIGLRRECKEIGVVDKAALWIPSWGCPHKKEYSFRIETKHTVVRGIL